MDQKTITFNDKEYTLDSHGFLDPIDQWDANFAEGMARNLGIHEGLTEAHWKFINYIRDAYFSEQTVPVVVTACFDNGLHLADLRQLFPAGYHRGACKIAGLNHAVMCDINIWLSYEMLPADKTEPIVGSLGFLKNMDEWDERFAHGVAREWGLPDGLTGEHWRIIHYLQDFYRNTGKIPTIIDTCRTNEISLDEFGTLFPGGYRRGACRAAGLPFIAG